jgi:hypothetical protein
MRRFLISLAMLTASVTAVAGPECEKCTRDVQTKVAACLQGGGSQVDCNKKYQSDAQNCANTCKAEADKARGGVIAVKSAQPQQPIVLAMSGGILGTGACHYVDGYNKVGCLANTTYESCHAMARTNRGFHIRGWTQNGTCP